MSIPIEVKEKKIFFQETTEKSEVKDHIIKTKIAILEVFQYFEKLFNYNIYYPIKWSYSGSILKYL